MTKIVQALGLAFGFVGQSVPDEVVREMAKELSWYPEDSVILALKRCRSELKVIRFSDILDRIPSQHPGVEEAWSQITKVMNNEYVSICWTDQMREAYGAAATLADDLVAARMAFKEVYVRAVSEARANRVLPSWSVSLGYDKSLRDECVREAEQKNLISQGYAAKLLAHDPPRDESVKLLEFEYVDMNTIMQEVTRALPTMPRAD
jgi:hypothetical protein